VPVIGLPEVSRGPLTASLVPPFGNPFAPQRPQAPVSDAEGPARPAPASSGLDSWLIDRLFGR